MTTERHPNFDFDLAYGKTGENRARLYLELWLEGNTKVETKRKSLSDPWFYIETEHDPGRTGSYQPSGLSTTEADLWAFIISETRIAVFIPTRILRAAIKYGWGTAKEGGLAGSCPTRGTLLSFNELVEIDLAFERLEKAPRCLFCHKPMLLGQDTLNHGFHYGCGREDA